MKRLAEAISILIKYDEKATIQGEHDALYIHVDEDLDCFIRHT